MLLLALHLTAALASTGLPDDAPKADPPAATASAPSPTLTPPLRVPLRPTRIPYRGGPVPDDYQVVDEYNGSLLLAGMTSLIVGYTGGVIFGLIGGLQSLAQIQRGDPLLAVLPLAGPLLALGGPGYRSQVNPDLLYVRDVTCLADAAVQWLGAALAVAGYFFPTKLLVLKEDQGGGAGVFLPLGPAGRPGLSWSVTFGP